MSNHYGVYLKLILNITEVEKISRSKKNKQNILI